LADRRGECGPAADRRDPCLGRQDFGNQARVWNPATGTFTSVPNSLTNMFCTGQCLLPDGRALVVGGHIGAHVGLPDTNIFNPATRTWSKVAPMAVGRWYPTVTQLPDGRMLVTSGEIDCGGCFAPIPEVYDPQFDHWTQLTGASQSFPYYPHMFVLSDGRVLAAASTEAPIVSRVLNIATQSWSVVDPNRRRRRQLGDVRARQDPEVGPLGRSRTSR
jgi:hypothetical protein